MSETIVTDFPCFTFPLRSFIEAKVSFNRRSGTHKLHFPDPSPKCSWNIPAQDFSLYKWEPNPPERNSRKSIKPERIKTVKQDNDNDDNKITESTGEHDRETIPRLKFVRSMRPHTAKILFVKCGSFKPGPYIMPKPHDHRGVSFFSNYVLGSEY
uniref:Embryonic stem cell-specific 5-hydroxymethylcytosine-binding protein n=1 Tax=Schistosoma mansoni TaxID=6183 RepID=A0A5K4FDQ8_SCHMA